MAKINIQADTAIAELKKLGNGLKDIRKDLNGINKVSGKAFKNLEKSMNQVGVSNKRLGDLVKTLSKNLRENTTQVKHNQRATRKNTTAVNTLTPAIEKQTKALEKNSKQNKTNTKSTQGLGKAMKAGALLYAAKKIIEYTVALFKMVKGFDSLKFAIQQTKKNIFDINQAYVFLGGLSRDFGVELRSTTERFLKFSEAAKQSGISLRDTQNIFRSMTKAGAVLGLATHELSGIYLALEQMLSKGKVTTEELRRQLGERLPGAMGIMAASMGKTIPELDKMMKKGEVLSAEVLPGFAVAMEQAFGIQNVRKVDTLQSQVGRLKGAWDSLIITISDSNSFQFAFKIISRGLSNLTGWLDKAFASSKRLIQIFQTEMQEDSIYELRLRGIKAFVKEQNSTLKKYYSTVNKLQRENLKIRSEIDALSNKEQTDSVKKQMQEKEEAIRQNTVRLGQIENKVIEKQKSISLEEINILKSTLAEKESLLKNSELAIPEFESGRSTQTELFNLEIAEGNVKRLTPQIGKLKADIDAMELMLQTSRKVLPGEEEDGDKKTQRIPKDIKSRTLEANQALIDSDIKVNREAIKNAKLTFDEKKRLIEEYDTLTRESAGNQELIANRDNDRERDKSLANLNKPLGKNELPITTEQREKAVYDIKERWADKSIEARQNYTDKIVSIETKTNESRLDLIEEQGKIELATIKSTFDEKQGQLTEEYNKEFTKAKDNNASYEELANLKKQYDKDIAQNAIESSQLQIDANINILQSELAIVGTKSIRGKQILAEIALLRSQAIALGDIGEKVKDDTLTTEEAFLALADAASEFFDGVSALGTALFDARIQEIDDELQANEDKYERLLELAKNDEEETKIILRNKALAEEALFKKKKDLQIKQAKFDKAMSIVQATINGAGAVVQALNSPVPLNVPLAIITGAAAALQIAAIVATPIPAFAKGGIMDYDGKAQINDGGNQEYIERNGSILTTMQKNAIVDLKRGDIIHKDYESLNKNSMIVSTLANGGQLTESDFERMYSGIEKSIEKGFNKARINNKVTVLNKVDTYRDKMQNWS